MKTDQVDTVICGAGIAGIATAYALAVTHRQRSIVLVDRYQPMSLTTSKSGENFRDYWPQACMSELAGHSLELIEALSADSDNAFDLHFSGYDFVSEQEGREIFPSDFLQQQSGHDHPVQVTHLANGGARPAYLSKSIRQIAHIPRAGAFDVHALGSLMLKRARKAGVELRYGMIDALQQVGDGYRVSLDRGDGQEDLHTQNLVLAAGPFVNDLAGMLGMNMPVESYLQRKFVIPDPLGIIPADMPFTIFADPQCLDWSEAEKHLIRDDPDYQWLLDEFPAGLHIKPESRGHIKLGWAYNRASSIPQWEVADDFDFPNVTLRGASRFIPALKPYVEQAPTPLVQFAGYYTRTRENWPLIGPLNTDGLYTVAALSGYGTMNACAAGELCAAWMTGSVLPSYAPYFHPDRYTDDAICAEMALLESDGQL